QRQDDSDCPKRKLNLIRRDLNLGLTVNPQFNLLSPEEQTIAIGIGRREKHKTESMKMLLESLAKGTFKVAPNEPMEEAAARRLRKEKSKDKGICVACVICGQIIYRNFIHGNKNECLAHFIIGWQCVRVEEETIIASHLVPQRSAYFLWIEEIDEGWKSDRQAYLSFKHFLETTTKPVLGMSDFKLRHLEGMEECDLFGSTTKKPYNILGNILEMYIKRGKTGLGRLLPREIVIKRRKDFMDEELQANVDLQKRMTDGTSTWALWVPHGAAKTWAP
ncbi:hypothetical protein BC829DRAFT_393339, partial [Chytridium lagenaria]